MDEGGSASTSAQNPSGTAGPAFGHTLLKASIYHTWRLPDFVLSPGAFYIFSTFLHASHLLDSCFTN